MTTLRIIVTAEDDTAACCILLNLYRLMDERKRACDIRLNDAGYTVSQIEGSGDVRVERNEVKP